MTPVVIRSDGGDCFAMYGPGSGPAVLICPPFGDEGLRTARVWRDLAVRLGGHGLASLRFDLPGTGNSAGEPTDPDRVGVWRAAIRACVAWLAARHGGRVILLGHRFGALLALDAVATGVAAERLVLLDPPETGRRLARQLRAQARMNGASPLPEGADYTQAGGVPLSTETLAALSALPASLANRCLPPALLVLRDGPTSPSPWPNRLREGGSDVETIPFTGFDDFVPHDAFRAQAPAVVLDRVVDTLVRTAGPLVPRPVSTLSPARLAFDRFEESPVAFGPAGRLFGILCRPDLPAAGLRPGLRPILLPTMGADPCSGMSRMWTELARRLARHGVTSLRFDMAGIGESDGESDGDLLSAMYHPGRVGDLRAAIDFLNGSGFEQVRVVAYCAGAYAAWHAAALDDRIAAVLVGNLLYLSHQPSLTRQALEVRPGASQFGAPGSLSRFLPPGSIAAFRRLDDRTRRAIPRPLRLMFRGLAHEPKQTRRHVEAMLARGCAVSLVMSDDDHGHVRLRRAYGETPRLPPGVELTVIPHADHQFTDRRHRAEFLDIAAAFALRPDPGQVVRAAASHPVRLLETV